MTVGDLLRDINHRLALAGRDKATCIHLSARHLKLLKEIPTVDTGVPSADRLLGIPFKVDLADGAEPVVDTAR